jgi:hypothetical protein
MALALFHPSNIKLYCFLAHHVEVVLLSRWILSPRKEVQVDEHGTHRSPEHMCYIQYIEYFRHGTHTEYTEYTDIRNIFGKFGFLNVLST